LGADILVRHGKIVTMNEARFILDDGAVAIEGNSIIDVGPDETIAKNYSADVIIDASAHVILPGLIDTHGHAGHGLIKTMAENHDEWNDIVSLLYTKYTDSDFWKSEGLLSALERISFGTTTGVSFLGGGSGSFRIDRPEIALEYSLAFEKVGLRGLIGVGPSGKSLPYNPQEFAGEYDAVTLDFSDQMKNASRAISWINSTNTMQRACSATNTIAPKSVQDGEEFRKVKEQSDAIRSLMKATSSRLISHGSGNTIPLASKLGLLGPEVSLAHCAGLTNEDMELIARTHTRVVHCPRARSIIKARCPVPELLNRSVLVSIGTDGNSPDRSYNLFEDMRMALKLHRTFAADPHVLSPGKVLEMTTIDAARVIGMEDKIGSIEKGKIADLILVDLKRPHLTPLIGMVVQRLVYEALGTDVDTVIVNGKVRMQDGKMIGVDEAEILERAEKTAMRVISKAGYSKYLETPQNFWRATRY
jgi:5-methylthioadenosine/S-adenosylhomocysteine deaminase